MRVYIGTYTKGQSEGIYVGRLDMDTGRLELTGAAGGVENPSFLAVDPQRHRLYAVGEVGEFAGQPVGAVGAFTLNPQTGQPHLLNSRPSGGAGPCHLSLDRDGRFVLVANYGGGTVALLPLEADGRLAEALDVVTHQGASVHPTRQDRPHAHSITPDPAGRYALAADLGVDQIFVYGLDIDSGRLITREPTGVSVTPGAGPRHLDFHPNKHHVYQVNEINSTLTVWDYDDKQGTLREVQTVSMLPAEFRGENTAADVHVHPSGRFVYASNRGHDSLAVFEIADETGRVTPRGHAPAAGANPRNFAIDPTGRFLLVAHQDSNTVVTLAIDPNTGALTPTGHIVTVPTPVCVQIVRED